jgi:2-oxoglutarate ferredoxin oxidoreductase subunit gamma
MTQKVIIAGAGGQGVMLLGKVIAYSALIDGKRVTLIPAYGPEVRGGAAHSAVILSDDEIGSPYIDTADVLVVMNGVALLKFKSRLNPGGLLVVNSSFVPEAVRSTKSEVIMQPFTDIATSLGDIRIANMVALGCLLARRRIVAFESVVEAMRRMAGPDKPQLFEINRKALLTGRGLR